MKISVVVPVYNAERFLRHSLESVLAQTHSEWECICVDDGSTDGSGALLDGYAAKDQRFRVVHQSNGGVASARNAGMDAATGDLVAFLDADDAFHPRALEVMAAAYAKTGADLIRYGWEIVDSHDKEFGGIPAEPTLEDVSFEDRVESPMRMATLGQMTVLGRPLADRMRWPGLTHCEDPLFLLRCLRESRRAVRIDAVLARYLVRGASASRAVSLQIVTATCLYLPQAYDACAALPGFAKSREDTCRFIAGFLDGPLKGCWRKLPRSDREEAKRAVLRVRWEMALRDPAFPRPKERIRYDLAFSIGSSCPCSEQVRNAGLQHLSFPGDWTGGPGFAERIEDLADGFTRLMSSPGDLVADGDVLDDGRHLNLVDARTGYHYAHDFPVGRSVEESFQDVRAKYVRRTERLMSLLGMSRRVLLVWMGESRHRAHVSDGDVASARSLLAARWPGKTFDFLVFTYRSDVSPADMVRSSGRGFDRFEFDYLSHEPGAPRWKFDDSLVQPMFRPFVVADYRTRGEKSAYRRTRLAKDFARFGVSSRLSLCVAKLEYKLMRHLQRSLERKGVRLG